VHAIVGASYGGMVGLAFAERYAERVDRLVVISAPHEPHPLSTAVRAVQRRVVELGLDTGKTHEALVLARSLAMTTYRSAREFADRFDCTPLVHGGRDATFAVERYLRHHGEKFAARWRPARYLALSLSGDLHAVDPSNVRTPAVLVAAQGDLIVPREQMEQLAARLAGPSRLLDLPTTHGHDAFLTEPTRVGRLLSDALTSDQLP
jgi:homoserine O-acetyltransferase